MQLKPLTQSQFSTPLVLVLINQIQNTQQKINLSPPRTMTMSRSIVGGIILVVLSLMSRVFVAEATEVLLPADAASTVCERIFEYFTNCLQFLIGDSSYGRHMRRCCQHVDKLNILAKHRIGPGTVCWCIQVMVKGTTPALQSSKIRDLPHVCNTTLSFPISDSMDCSKVHRNQIYYDDDDVQNGIANGH
ncbi:non-specific lipid-transfer protein 13-like [Lotus japonicus]|uniref:non-specific lipid-transfer protein 13-like n=1 Tax=Lotus japonicus TaxID=34305 RepID=UPI00258DECC1|nr:non-specific lipid-transfer protein 13-like [Lotus japonicus]